MLLRHAPKEKVFATEVRRGAEWRASATNWVPARSSAVSKKGALSFRTKHFRVCAFVFLLLARFTKKTRHSGEPPGGVVRSGFSTPCQNGSETNKKKGACRTHEGLPVIYRRKVGMTSSPHGPYGLGHTRATMAITMGSKAVRRSESGKIASVRIVLCNSGTWSWNR